MSVMMEEMKVTRINHVPDILKKRKMSASDFVTDAGYKTRLSRPVLYDAALGREISYDTAEKLAWFFGVKPHEVLESKFEGEK